MKDSNTEPSDSSEELSDKQFTDELIEAPQEAKSERINPKELKDDAAKRAKTRAIGHPYHARDQEGEESIL